MGHAWLKVEAMNGRPGVVFESESNALGGRGIGMGMLGLIVAEVGIGGSASKAGVNPGISSVTTFSMAREFCGELGL